MSRATDSVPEHKNAGPNGAATDEAEKKDRASQADLLVQLARTKADLFHDPHDDAFATIVDRQKRETVKLRSTRFRSWMDREFFAAFKKCPGGQAKADAIGVLEGLALHDQPRLPVCLRYAEVDGMIFIDLANEAREIVRADADGWTIVRDAPVKFIRPKGMLPLPRPVRGGTVNALRRFVNVADDHQFILLMSWIVNAMKPRGPYAILAFVAEHGAAKSTCSRFARALVDPNISPIRSVPREVRDLAVAAKAGHVLAYDNLSGVQPWLSDALCRLATGGGFSTRGLYTDDEEIIFDFIRPVIVNGIDNIAERADLADRCLILSLPTIPKHARKREKVLQRDFEKAAPAIYGAILDGLVAAIRGEDAVDLPELPRMADFAAFATAAEEGLGFNRGAFMAAYTDNQRQAVQTAVEADALATSVLSLLETRTEWSGSASSLLVDLGNLASEEVKKERGWPRSAGSLSNRLRRAAPSLRALGIEIVNDRDARPKVVKIARSGARAPVEKSDGSDGTDGTDGRAEGPEPPVARSVASHAQDRRGEAAYAERTAPPVAPVADSPPSSSCEPGAKLWPEVTVDQLSELQQWVYEQTGEVRGVRVRLSTEHCAKDVRGDGQ